MKFNYFVKALLITMFVFLSTGCVKYNAQMDIKADKSMDFSIIYALDTSVFGETNIFEEEDIKNLKDEGYKVTKYTDGKMKGYKLSLNIKNIDDVSSTDNVSFNLSDTKSDSKKDDLKLFKVQKGFFKNKYSADFKFDSNDSNLNSTTNSSLDNTESDDDYSVTSFDEEIDSEFNTSFDEASYNSGMQFAASNMDLSFNVKLPYSVVSSNASSKDNDNKELSWALTTQNGENNIKFEFELYNYDNIIGTIAIIIIVICLVIIFILKKKNNKAAL